jgi:hypothetical protein
MHGSELAHLLAVSFDMMWGPGWPEVGFDLSPSKPGVLSPSDEGSVHDSFVMHRAISESSTSKGPPSFGDTSSSPASSLTVVLCRMGQDGELLLFLVVGVRHDGYVIVDGL